MNVRMSHEIFYRFCMATRTDIQVREGLSELRLLKRRQPTLSRQKRVLALIHLKTGRFATRQQLALHLGVSVRTLERWIKTYHQQGLEPLLAPPARPRTSKTITPAIHQGLAERVQDPAHPFRGYWEAQQWVEEQFGVVVNYFALRAYLIRHFKTRLKQPRQSHIKKDPEAASAFLKKNT